VSTQIAVITDPHANLPALEATLDRIAELGVETIYCGGDLVGYGPRPNEVCALLEERQIPTIYGNYDYAIARDLEDCGCAYRDAHEREIGQLSVEWTLANTRGQAKRFMHDLPFDLRFELGGRRIRVVHGSPRKVNEYLFYDRPPQTFERIARIADADVLVFGHTHQPWVEERSGMLFVNCGAVGKPKDGDPRASFAVLTARDGGLEVAIERVPYDAKAVADEMLAVGLPADLADSLVAAT
jgi:putative phosphoesterase